MNDIKLLEEKMEQGFVPCFNSGCNRREHCMRWQGRVFVGSDKMVVTCVNPLMGGDECRMYRHDEKVRMALGFNRLLEQLPRKMGDSLMKSVIKQTNRTYAYEQRKGTRHIPPALQQHIADFCRSQGWQGSVEFDAYEEQYDW